MGGYWRDHGVLLADKRADVNANVNAIHLIRVPMMPLNCTQSYCGDLAARAVERTESESEPFDRNARRPL